MTTTYVVCKAIAHESAGLQSHGDADSLHLSAADVPLRVVAAWPFHCSATDVRQVPVAQVAGGREVSLSSWWCSRAHDHFWTSDRKGRKQLECLTCGRVIPLDLKGKGMKSHPMTDGRKVLKMRRRA